MNTPHRTTQFTPRYTGPESRADNHTTNKFFLTACVALALAACSFSATAANIVWVGDYNDVAGAANDTFSAWTPAGDDTITDSGTVRLLIAAGHNVVRYNSPGAATALMSQADLDALNTNDLVILSRAGNSPAFQAPKGLQWNTNIVKPLICMSPYFVRPDGGRLGWFTGGTLPDTTPTVLTAGDPNAVGTDYIFSGVLMNGLKTAFPYDEMLDRNTSLISNPPVDGAIVYATATFPSEANGTETTAYVIVGFPAGTVVAAGRDVLAGYRMWFGGTTREAGTGFPTTVNGFAGRENLTATGENVFLRAVELAINNGVPPTSNPSTPSIVSLSGNVTVVEGRAATFSVEVSGAGPRTVQWQRGDGIAFTDLPDSTPFLKSQLSLPNVTTADDGAQFRVVVSTPNGIVTSDSMTLTVTPDAAPPVPVSANSLDGTSVVVFFDEEIDPAAAEFPFSYEIVSSSGSAVILAAVRADGHSVDLTIEPPLSETYSINVSEISDLYLNAISTPVNVPGVNLGLSSADIGALNPTGGIAALDSNLFEVSGGGFDFQAVTEQMRLVYKSVSGDFDARIRVRSLVGAERLESVAKAILNARSNDSGDSPSISAFVTPPHPANNTFGSVARATTGGPTLSNAVANANSLNAIPATIPDAWLRIVRSGDSFTTYSSADGTTWSVLMPAATIAMGDPVLVGAGVNSHRNGQIATATFSDFTIHQGASSPTLMNSGYAAGTFSASFQTQNGVSYRIQYKDDLNAGGWTDLTTIAGDGTVKTFSDTAGANRFYQIVTP